MESHALFDPGRWGLSLDAEHGLSLTQRNLFHDVGYIELVRLDLPTLYRRNERQDQEGFPREQKGVHETIS